MSRAGDAFQRFIARARALFAEETDVERRWERLRPILGELLSDRDFAAHAESWPLCIQRDRAENLLFYEDPEFGFVVNGLVKAPRTRTQVHDHAHNWTLYGVLRGTEVIERYERLDDGSRADHAEVREIGRFEARPGDVDLVRPWQIHAEASLEERTVAVIVRSEKAGGFLQGRYDPATGRYWQGYGPYQVPYAIE
jgi:predicted metal-dependent enzyme (double-stranded beta helix superfamily)